MGRRTVGYLMAYLLYHCTTSAFWDFGTTTPDPVRGDLTPRQSFFRWQKVDRPWHCWGLPWSIILQRKRNTRLYTIAGVSIDFIPLGTAVILNRRTLITAANYLDPYLTRQRDVRVWCLGRGGDHILPYRYRVWRVRRIFPRSINPEHCHGIKCEHVPRHDIAIVHTMDPIYLYNQIYERYMYAFRAYICRKYQKLKSYVWFTGSGYEYDLHIKENYKIFIHMTPLFDKLKDCSIYLPKWWGKFICVANDVDFSGISNGGGFFSTDYHYSSTSGFEWDNLLFGIACFEIRYNDDRIWVFTDLRYYIDYVKIYANITRAAYYEYAYPEWSAYDQGWQSIYSGHFGVRYIPNWDLRTDHWPLGK
ncbi:uncharacterized protein LOC132903959 [Amyelois transitella]|uniref:uncharacterized protein LOC132903959 n=1 Tax=Amyelois transitella TaxID=680683 RepID=UPI0029907CC3|nr:uncharacterized protein LOC132903959 [Amyelois transitella]